jgi:hypothetical protein
MNPALLKILLENTLLSIMSCLLFLFQTSIFGYHIQQPTERKGEKMVPHSLPIRSVTEFFGLGQEPKTLDKLRGGQLFFVFWLDTLLVVHWVFFP